LFSMEWPQDPSIRALSGMQCSRRASTSSNSIDYFQLECVAVSMEATSPE
jgi:hypothetical protein